MKTIIITGSARGFGYAMIEEFYKKSYNVVMCDINEFELKNASNRLYFSIFKNYIVIQNCIL